MPWCDECSRFWPHEEMELAPDGAACPTCQKVLGPPPKAPWHFKLLVVAVVAYLGLRAWQGLDWVITHM